MSPSPHRLTLAAGKSKFSVRVEPLFQSIKEKPKVGLAQAPQWHIVAAADEADEVNVWDLCHQAMTGGLGMAAGGRVELLSRMLSNAGSLVLNRNHCWPQQAPVIRRRILTPIQSIVQWP